MLKNGESGQRIGVRIDVHVGMALGVTIGDDAARIAGDVGIRAALPADAAYYSLARCQRKPS